MSHWIILLLSMEKMNEYYLMSNMCKDAHCNIISKSEKLEKTNISWKWTNELMIKIVVIIIV